MAQRNRPEDVRGANIHWWARGAPRDFDVSCCMKPGEAFFLSPDSADGMLMACTGSYVSQMDRHQFYLEEVSIYSKLPTEQGTTCVCRLGTNSTRL